MSEKAKEILIIIGAILIAVVYIRLGSNKKYNAQEMVEARQESYDRGYEDGYEAGYDDGYYDGLSE